MNDRVEKEKDGGPAKGLLPPARNWLLPGSQTLFLGILALIASFAVVRVLQPVLMPLAFAWILSAMLAPMVRKLARGGVPYGLAVTFALLVTVFLFFRAGILVNELVSSFVAKYADYSAKLTSLLKFFYAKLPPRAVEVLTAFDWQTRAGKMVMSLSGLLISVSSKVVMVLIVTAFLLIEQRDFGKKLESAFPDHIADKIGTVLGGITNQVSRYLLLQFVISLATGLCVWLALWAIGVEFSLTWGALAFVLNFIPTIGSIIASIPPVLVALVQYAPDSYWQAVVTALALLAIQMTIGNVISPRVMGDHLNLSPVAVLVFLLFWSWLWGPAGALLSVPITAATKIVCDNIGPLSPVGVLLGSGRALEPSKPPVFPRPKWFGKPLFRALLVAAGLLLVRPASAADAVQAGDFFTFEPRPVVTGAFFRPADGGGCYAADIQAGESAAEGNAFRATYAWGDVETTYERVSPTRLDIAARIRVNEGRDDLHGLYLELGRVTFAREVETFNRSFLFYCESPIAHNQGAPAIVDVRDGERGLAVRSDDLRHEIGVGLAGGGKVRTLLALTGRHPETKAMNYPWIERPIRAGSSDIWRFSLVWGEKVPSLPELSRDLYEAYAKLHPFTLKWEDRRPIARVFCASSPYPGFPPASNPRGWFNDRDVNTVTPEGLVQFSNRVDVVARQTVSVMKKYGAQGCVVWDIEGQQYWHPTSYLGDPRSIPAEMEPHADRFFCAITNAGFRVGVCIRPQRPVRGAYDGKVDQMQFLSRAERFRNLCAKIDCARRRWGCTLFYVDSDIEFVPDEIVIPGAWGVSAFKDSQIMRDLAAKYPDSLFIPEWQDLRTYANCAPYSNMKFDRIFDPGEIVRIAYPNAFLVNVANDLDLRSEELRAGFVKSIREGNIVCIDGWYDNAALNVPVRAWYDEAAALSENDANSK